MEPSKSPSQTLTNILHKGKQRPKKCSFERPPRSQYLGGIPVPCLISYRTPHTFLSLKQAVPTEIPARDYRQNFIKDGFATKAVMVVSQPCEHIWTLSNCLEKGKDVYTTLSHPVPQGRKHREHPPLLPESSLLLVSWSSLPSTGSRPTSASSPGAANGCSEIMSQSQCGLGELIPANEIQEICVECERQGALEMFP